MSERTPNPETRIARFRGQKIRRTFHNNEWWFVVVDVIAATTGTVDPRRYLKDMRRQDATLAHGWKCVVTPLLIATAGGPQPLNCANTERLLRLLQGIPRHKAKPFQRWLATQSVKKVNQLPPGKPRKKANNK